jgi:hypothetical protein
MKKIAVIGLRGYEEKVKDAHRPVKNWDLRILDTEEHFTQ